LTLHQEFAAERGYRLSAEQVHLVERIFAGDYDRHSIQLAKLFKEGALDRDTLSYSLPDVWRYKLDNCSLPTELWREMFRASDFTVDGRRARRPRRRVRLFRGATGENRAGLSWTRSLVQANYFATYRQDPDGPLGQVWATVAPPQYLLARLPKKGEGEYVVDARGLTIRPVDAAALRTRFSARLPAIRLSD
jgi:hypothetical protein